MSEKNTDEVLFQFDTTLGQASVDGNLMPLMLFSMRRDGSGNKWLIIRVAAIVGCIALCFLNNTTVTMLAILFALAFAWDLFTLTDKGLERQMKQCLKFAQRQGPSYQDPNGLVRIFFTEKEFSVWKPDEEKKLMGFLLDKLFVVESSELFFITFESKKQRFRRRADNITTVVRKDALTYGDISEFRVFLQKKCKNPIKTYAIDYPHVQHLVDEINRITFTS